MSRRPARFTQADIVTALRAAGADSTHPHAVIISPGGEISVEPWQPEPSAPATVYSPDGPLLSWTESGEIIGIVYFIGFDNYIKIGFTTNLRSRIASIQTAIPKKLILYASVKGTYRDENNFHKKFKKHRLNGEWFNFVDEIKSNISEIISAKEIVL